MLKAGHYWKENEKRGINTKTRRKMSSQEGKWRGRGEPCQKGSECIALRMKVGNQERVWLQRSSEFLQRIRAATPRGTKMPPPTGHCSAMVILRKRQRNGRSRKVYPAKCKVWLSLCARVLVCSLPSGGVGLILISICRTILSNNTNLPLAFSMHQPSHTSEPCEAQIPSLCLDTLLK